MEINRSDSLGMDRARLYSQAGEQTAPSEEAQKAEKQKQDIAPPAAAGEGAETRQAAARGSRPAAAQAARTVQADAATVTSQSDDEDDSDYQTILAKLNSGQTLTASELNTLRSKDPARYSQAMQAQTARQQLRGQMEEDPSHAMQAAREAMAQVRGADSEELSAVLQAMQSESAQFAARYDQVEFSQGGQLAMAQALEDE